MVDTCFIGPVSIADAHLFDNNEFSFSNDTTKTVTSNSNIFTRGQYSEQQSFSIVCSLDKALQLKGVVEQGEIIWMNTSDLTDNDFFQHKGWVILTRLDIDHDNLNIATCKLDYIKISDHEKEYLAMNYSQGIYDGISFDPTYDITANSDKLAIVNNDNTTQWGSQCEYPGAATSSWSNSGGTENRLSIKSSVHNTLQHAWVFVDKAKFTPPFTLEVELDNIADPATGHTALTQIALSPSVYGNGDKQFVTKGKKQYLACNIQHTNTARKLNINTVLSTGKTATMYQQSTGVGLTGTLQWQIKFYYNGYVRISEKVNGGADWIQLYYGPSNIPNFKNGMYITFAAANNDNAVDFVAQIKNLHVYNGSSVAFPNTVALPVGSTSLITTTGTRASEDGNIPYILNPDDMIPFTVATSDYYKGSVKLYSTNNIATTSRLATSTGTKLTPTTTTLKNGLTQLTMDANNVIVSAWTGAAYTEINRFNVGTIGLVRALRITPNIVVLQVNNTKWTLRRGDPIMTVEHPYTDMTYTLKDRYYHDGTTTSSPAAGASISMQNINTGYYATIYNNAADTYRLLIVKGTQCDIISDSIPADTMTGIGWVNNGATGYETADKLAQAFYKQTRTGISLRQII